MRRTLTPLLLVVLVVLSSAMASGSPAVGSWSSTDAVDGSSQTMRITRSLQLRLVDDAATACGGAAATATGRLAETADGVAGQVTVRCAGGGDTFVVEIVFTYDPVDDTLTDAFEPEATTWVRD